MIETIGHLGLVCAVLGCAVGLVGSLNFRRISHRIVNTGLAINLAGLTLAMGMLFSGLFSDDFGLNYVAHHSERGMWIGYKFAALWAGQEGSLLLWGWMLGCANVWYILGKTESPQMRGVATGILSVIGGCFGLILLVAANPFNLIDVVPGNGQGLNPMLMDPAMIAHPPMLFAGYAGFAIPFAMVLGSLFGDASDRRWLSAARKWAVGAWLFLTVGIILGAQWAYTVLGWGGYWEWDAVENASLLPWLTGTALVHSIIVQQKRGIFNAWTAWLAAGTFILTIFGTYLTRSGIVNSVHGYGASVIGNVFLAFLLLSIVGTVGILVWKRDRLVDEKVETTRSKEGLVQLGNVVLVLMTVLTLVGTMYPVITRVFGAEKTLPRGFFDYFVGSLGLVLVGLMIVGSVMGFVRRGRIGWILAHGGMVLLVIGVIGSSVFNQKQVVQMRVGESVRVSGWSLALQKVESVTEAKSMLTVVSVLVMDDRGQSETLRPGLRQFVGMDETMGVVAIRSTWKSDLYLSLEEAGKDAVKLAVHVNPLVEWIWVGAMVMGFGGVMSLVARLRIRRPQTVTELDDALAGAVKVV